MGKATELLLDRSRNWNRLIAPGVILVGMAFTGGPVRAQTESGQPIPDTDTPRTHASTDPREGKAKPETRSGARRQVIDGKSARAHDRYRKPEMNPNAKWACDKQTVTLDPVWRDGNALTFEFDIRNEGTADLEISARGG